MNLYSDKDINDTYKSYLISNIIKYASTNDWDVEMTNPRVYVFRKKIAKLSKIERDDVIDALFSTAIRA